MSSQSNSALMSDSNDERYEQELEKRRQEAEAKLWEEEERQRAERKARKEARAAEKRRQEEELRRRAEEKEARRKAEEEEHQRDLAHQLEVDHIAAMEQQRRKNWTKTFLPSSPPSDKDMNLIDLLPLTKRQRIRHLPQETLEARQRREELAKEMGVPAVGGGSLYERCADFGILCIPQNLP